MFILNQRNLIFNVNKFIINFNNSKNVKINDNNNTFDENAKLKITKLKIFDDN